MYIIVGFSGMYHPEPVQNVPMPNEPQESMSHMNRYQNFYRPTHFEQSQPMATAPMAAAPMATAPMVTVPMATVPMATASMTTVPMASDSQFVQVPQQQPEHSSPPPSASELTSQTFYNKKFMDLNISDNRCSSDIPSRDTGNIYLFFFYPEYYDTYNL